MSLSDEWPCPVCGASVGEPCHVPIRGVDTTGWDHDARILAPVRAALSERGDR
jgi:hypothetical protein